MAVERSRGGHVRKVYLPFSTGSQAYCNGHDITLAGDGGWVLDTLKRGDLFRLAAVPNIGHGENEVFGARHVAPLPWVSEQVWYASMPVIFGISGGYEPGLFLEEPENVRSRARSTID